ncbi:TPA: hypothetical protein JRX32_000319 [Elizabethkingia anophelis]|nr:hypothetical protein [Elizabethkingia anophelis]HAY3533735.1 hypothetical protein [Elizabethkingia anophelis]HAY3545851.1 hypothetical protein [Elizabethkingia anophelis]HAY3590677.1 hypothetical protein [Elizabethkingia anophelis]
MEKTMFLSEVLLDMKKNPKGFSLEYRTFNKYNKTGGKYVICLNVELLRPPSKKGVKRLSDPTPFKNPNHFKNRTRNFKINGDIKTIHIVNIIRYNGYLVVL